MTSPVETQQRLLWNLRAALSHLQHLDGTPKTEPPPADVAAFLARIGCEPTQHAVRQRRAVEDARLRDMENQRPRRTG